MKQKILDALKAKFEGVSAFVLDRIAEKLSKTVSDEGGVQAAADGVTLQQVIESYADGRATDAANSAIKNYEHKYGLQAGKSVEQNSGAQTQGEGGAVQQPTAGGAEIPQWAQALVDSNKELSQRLAQMEGERTTSQRKQQLSGVLSKLPDSLKKAYERTPVEGLTDEQFTTLLGEVTTEVDGLVQATAQKGAVFGRPTAAGGGSQGGELSKEQQAAIAHRDNKPADGGQPF